MIKKFPFFTKLSLEHKDFVEKFVSQFPPYSDYNFTSLWTYNTDESLELSLLNDNLTVKFKDYLTGKPFYSFLGRTKVKKTIDTLLNMSARKKIDPVLNLIPQTVIDSDDKIEDHFKITEDKSNHDYVVSAKEIALLPEKKFKRKKYLVERFKRKYLDYKVKLIDLSRGKNRQLIIDLFFLWEKRSGLKRNNTQNEFTAIKRFLQADRHFKVFTHGIFHKDKLIAFNIYEVTHQKYGISAFQKADKTFTGIYSLLTHEVAKHLFSLKCEYINYEQDLGIEGLRLSKSLWKPVHYLKKYTISQK